MHFLLSTLLLVGFSIAEKPRCTPSVSTASGTFAPNGDICPGAIIFQEEFDAINFRKWQHENTLGGGGNEEFQWYTNNSTNSYVKDRILYLKPTLTAYHMGETFLSSDILDMNGGSPADECCNSFASGGDAVEIPVSITPSDKKNSAAFAVSINDVSEVMEFELKKK